MSKDINRVMLIGRLTKDAELRHTPNGTAVATLSIANSYVFGSGDSKREQVSYFDCVAWSKLAEICAEYCKKGTRIAIEGRLNHKRWDDQEGKKRSAVEVVIDNLQLLSKPADAAGKVQNEFNGQPSKFEDNPFSDDDVPF